MNIKVRIIYHDEYVFQLGRQYEEIILSSNIHNACKSIKKHLKKQYLILTPYKIKIKGVSLRNAVKNNIELKEGDTVDIFPNRIISLICRIYQNGYISKY